ncbi:HTH-type transcriptional regulator ImmR [Lentibacillus kapialis]|uniref:HTH-type transcriptional regulator ImmR n=1 Tax=Lentibacillus kapialis TaxID=340214 RepID=A0A917PZ42_9BACI|nr:helix-turn-helix transcriptional regulator [Lentibacillus kapialis]GGK00740.1 HTH-type transcriptional regulator ImmR [Lentibacillus kapialis]
MNVLGKRLKEARVKAGYKQVDACKKLGISNGTLSGYERNYRDPDTQTLNKMATLYEVSVDWLIGNSEDPEPTKEDDFDSLTALKEIVEDLGIEDLFFHNIDDIRNLSPEAVEDIKNHLEYTIYKEKQRREEENKK